MRFGSKPVSRQHVKFMTTGVNDLAQGQYHLSVLRSVHDDAIGDDEADRHARTEVENVAIDLHPVENILRLAIAILHAKRNAATYSSERASRAQWWVLTFSMHTMKSESSTFRDSKGGPPV